MRRNPQSSEAGSLMERQMEALRNVADAVSKGGDAGPQMTETLRRFCEECRSTLEPGAGSSTLAQVKQKLENMLKEGTFIREYCTTGLAPGLHLLYEDAGLGFQVLLHLNDKGRASPPHDHGASWAIYGQALGHTDMTDWERTNPQEDIAKGQVRKLRTYRLLPGDAGLFADGAIHSIAYEAGSSYVRVTGTNLDTIERTLFNLSEGTARKVGGGPR